MRNISMKKALAILMIALLIVSVSTLCFASGMPSPDEFQGTQGQASNGIQNLSNTILGIVQVIGVAVAVIMLVILAIKYLSAAPGEKAEIKKSAFIYVIGALLLFGGVALLTFIQRSANEFTDELGSVTVIEQKSDIEVA